MKESITNEIVRLHYGGTRSAASRNYWESPARAWRACWWITNIAGLAWWK